MSGARETRRRKSKRFIDCRRDWSTVDGRPLSAKVRVAWSYIQLSAMVADRSTNLTTKRCVLRPITPDDAAQLHELWSSPGVRRFLWDDEIIPIARTRAAIEQSQTMFDEQAYGLWGAWPSACAKSHRLCRAVALSRSARAGIAVRRDGAALGTGLRGRNRACRDEVTVSTRLTCRSCRQALTSRIPRRSACWTNWDFAACAAARSPAWIRCFTSGFGLTTLNFDL